VKEINTDLSFDGNCREAMTFYAKCLGAEVQIVKFSETPCTPSKEAQDRVADARIAKGSAVGMRILECSPINLGSIGCSISTNKTNRNR
jgi:PhnB protein